MAKLNISNISNIQNDQTAVTTINSNNDAIEVAMDKALFRDGTSPNQMEAVLDMNSNRIINLTDPFYDHEAVRKEYVDGIIQTLVMGEIPTEAIEDAVNDFLSGGPVGTYSDLNTALGNVPEGAAFFQVSGRNSPGDKGAAFWINIGAEPSDSSNTRYAEAANGEWYEMSMTIYTPQMFGAVADGVTNDTIPVKDWWNTLQEKQALGLWSGDYLIDEGELIWTHVSGSPSVLQGAGGTFGTYTGGNITLVRPGLTGGNKTVTIPNNTSAADLLTLLNNSCTQEFEFELVDGQIKISYYSSNAGQLSITGDNTLLTTIGFASGNRTGTTATATEMEPGPNIFTSSLNIYASGAEDKPIIQIKNKTPHRFIIGGYIGPINLYDETGDTAPNRHGIVLSGVQGLKFDYILGNLLRGDLVHCSNRSLDGNSDSHHVFGCQFQGIEHDNCEGWTFNNQVLGQGTNGCTFGILRALGNFTRGKGAWYGGGAGNICNLVSCGYHLGYAIDWSDSTNGQTRNQVLGAELDGTQYGIRFTGGRNNRLVGVRFVHRSNDEGSAYSSIPEGEVWPLVPIDIGADVGSGTEVVADLDIECYHRISNNINPAENSFPWADLHNNGNVTTVNIKHRIIDERNPPVTMSTSDFISNVNATSVGIVVTANYIQNVASVNISFSEHVYDNRTPSHFVQARASSSAITINADPNWGNISSTAPMTFLHYDTRVFDQHQNFSTSTYKYTIPYPGWYHVYAKAMLALGDGNRVRMAVVRQRPSSTSQNILCEKNLYANGTQNQTYDIQYTGFYNAGDLVGVCLDTTAAAFLPNATIFGHPAINTIQINTVQNSF